MAATSSTATSAQTVANSMPPEMGVQPLKALVDEIFGKYSFIEFRSLAIIPFSQVCLGRVRITHWRVLTNRASLFSHSRNCYLVRTRPTLAPESSNNVSWMGIFTLRCLLQSRQLVGVIHSKSNGIRSRSIRICLKSLLRKVGLGLARGNTPRATIS